MKSKILVFSYLLIILISPLFADNKNISVETGYVSRYIWRGFDLIPDNYDAIQPSITYTFGETGFWINFFSSFGIKERTNTKFADELDCSIGCDKMMFKRSVTVSIGLAYYTFPHLEGKNTTPEIFANFIFLKSQYSPILTVYYDMNMGDGFYILSSISRTIEPLPLSFGISLGYNNNQYIEDSGISDIIFSSSYELTISQVTLTPTIYYAYIPMDEVNNENEFWTSIKITF